jgi:hypothetical protein
MKEFARTGSHEEGKIAAMIEETNVEITFRQRLGEATAWKAMYLLGPTPENSLKICQRIWSVVHNLQSGKTLWIY